MGYWDRHWWPRAAGALLCIALAATFAVWFSTRLLPLDLHRGSPFISSDVLLAGDIVGVLLGVALFAVIKMVLARRRLARINAAIEGNQEALPVANVAREYAIAQVDVEDVVAAWPHPRLAVFVSLFVFLSLCAAAAFVGAWPVYFVLEALHAPVPAWLIAFLRWSSPAQSNTHTFTGPGPSPVGALLSGILFFGSMSLIALFASLASLRAALSQPARVVANDDGMVWQSVWGQRRLIGWHEARLLEIAAVPLSQGGPPRWQCTLYNWTSAIQWLQPVDSAPGLGSDQFVRVTLCAITRTGLQPRTLDSKLLPPGQSLPTTFLERIQIRVVRTLVMAALGVGMLAFGEVGPWLLTGIGIFALAGALLTLADKWPFQTGRSPSQSVVSAHLPEAAPLAFDRDAVYEANISSAFQFRLNKTFFLLFGAGSVVFGLFLAGDLLTQDFTHTLSMAFLEDRGNQIAAVVITAFVLGGAAILIVGLRARQAAIVASAQGIRLRAFLGTQFICWSDITNVQLRYVGGKPITYRVVGNRFGYFIAWPYHVGHPTSTVFEPGAHLISTEQMATLATVRSGRPITDVYR